MNKPLSIFCVLFALAAMASAQTVLSPMPRQCFNDTLSAGKPLSGGKIFTYQAGTSVQQATFTDATGLSQNTNPVILDVAGCSSIWLTSGQSYRFVAQNSTGVQEWVTDQIAGLATTSSAFSQAITTVSFSATPAFVPSGQFQLFKMTLTGNVTSSSINMTGITVPSTVTFELTQDATGGRSFSWPLNSVGGLQPTTAANSVSTQTFVWDGTTLYPSATANGTQIPVESFGAVGDAALDGAGTDDTGAIQTCLNSLPSGSVCVLQPRLYKACGLTINKSAIGLVGFGGFQPNSAAFTSNPTLSGLVCTSASSDILNISGVSTSNMLYGNSVKNLSLIRSTIPTGTAKGLSLSYSYKAQISNVVSLDSIYGFYFHGVGSMGFGYIENSIASWGYNGVTETTGSLYGFYVDTSSGIFSPSIRIRNTHVASNLGTGVTTYGYASVGTLVSDLHLMHPESVGLNYGIYINNSGVGYGTSSDINIVDPVLDGCTTACIYVAGLTGSVGINGGWLFTSGANAVAADFENGAAGSQASMVNVGVYGSGITGSTGVIIGHSSYNVQLIGNKIQMATSSSPAIFFNGVTAGTISGNTVWSTAGTPTLVSLASTINVSLANNVLNGVATNGFLLDSSTHGIAGLETNTCGASIGAITNCEVDNGGNIQAFISGVLIPPVAFSALPTCNAALEGATRAVNNSNTATFNATVAGAGTNHIKAYCNGTNWVAH